MKDLFIRNVFVLIIMCTSILSFSLYSQATTIKNDLIAWGFRRGENHLQSVLDTKAEKIIREFLSRLVI